MLGARGLGRPSGAFAMRRAVLFAAPLVALLAAGAALAGADAGGYIAKGRELLDKGNASTAIIQLKNAVQSDPASGEALYLLGRAFYEAGNWPDAERSLRAAGEHG